jgi:hypothetical protein
MPCVVGAGTVQVIQIEPNCLWTNVQPVITVTIPHTTTWEFQNESGAPTKLIWKSGSHYATDQWSLQEGEWMKFTQQAATSSTFTTCSGKATLHLKTT